MSVEQRNGLGSPEQENDTVSLVQLVLRADVDGIETLSDAELASIEGKREEISNYLYRVWFDGMNSVSREIRYRERRQELGNIHTEELQDKAEDIKRWRSRELSEDWNDDLPDSFFEAPRKDSDEHIITEILVERRAADSI